MGMEKLITSIMFSSRKYGCKDGYLVPWRGNIVQKKLTHQENI